MSTITMPYQSTNTCFICENPASNVIFSPIDDDFSITTAQQYLACADCYEVVRTDIIPKDKLHAGIISKYNYNGNDTEGVLSNQGGECKNPHTPTIQSDEFGTVDVALSCKYQHQYIVVVDDGVVDDGGVDEVVNVRDRYRTTSNKSAEYFIPVFFIERLNRRNYAMVRHYNLSKLYRENTSTVGYYEINKNGYVGLSKHEKDYIDYHNNILFNMMLMYNDLGKTIIDLAGSTGDNYFTILPIELLHIIIKLMFTSENIKNPNCTDE